jgi:methionyl aminopeptidase
MIVRKSPQELELMARAGRVVAEIHEILRDAIRPGTTTAELDALAEQEIRARDAVPSFKGYRGFPASLCTSVNHEIVHGIPSPNVVLAEGDLIKIDAGAIVDGYHGDSAVTWIVGGETRQVALVDHCLSAIERQLVDTDAAMLAADAGPS